MPKKSKLSNQNHVEKEGLKVSNHNQIITRYFNAANTGDADQMLSCFHEDICAYATSIPARLGAIKVAQYLLDLREHTGAHWTIDRILAQQPEAAVEWSCVLHLPGESNKRLLRGIDWLTFEKGKIKEIHEWSGSKLTPESPVTFELQGFPYKKRGYPLMSET